MSRRLLGLVGLLLLAWPASAQFPAFPRPLVPYASERIAVWDTPVGLTQSLVVPATGRPADYVEIVVETPPGFVGTPQLRCTIDGTTPTSSVGTLRGPGVFTLAGLTAIDQLSCVRVGRVAGTLAVTYWRMAP